MIHSKVDCQGFQAGGLEIKKYFIKKSFKTNSIKLSLLGRIILHIDFNSSPVTLHIIIVTVSPKPLFLGLIQTNTYCFSSKKLF